MEIGIRMVYVVWRENCIFKVVYLNVIKNLIGVLGNEVLYGC